MVNGVVLSTVCYTLVSSIVSQRLYAAQRPHGLSRGFDQVCVEEFPLGLLSMNIAVMANAAL